MELKSIDKEYTEYIMGIGDKNGTNQCKDAKRTLEKTWCRKS